MATSTAPKLGLVGNIFASSPLSLLLNSANKSSTMPIHSQSRARDDDTANQRVTSDRLTTSRSSSDTTAAMHKPKHSCHLHLMENTDYPNHDTDGQPGHNEIKSTPLFSRGVQIALESKSGDDPTESEREDLLPQYGFMGIRSITYRAGKAQHPVEVNNSPSEHDIVYANTNSPWSAFICGSQGGGKSHTLSCLLENCLLSPSPVGRLPKPLTGIVFHYDKFTSLSSTQFCEAAYLCSAGVPVTVLVSPSNIWAMEKLYGNLPGLPANAPPPTVRPLCLKETQLNVSNMMTLMSIEEGTHTPLYLEVLYKILRDLAIESKGRPGIDYQRFKYLLEQQRFTRAQASPLNLRLQLLESLMQVPQTYAPAVSSTSAEDIWKFAPGSLTIVDLSCPFVNEQDACSLFMICLGIFLENRCEGGRVVALDEAHKFLTQTGAAEKLTNQLTSIIRQQRHLGTRIIIATQEPTLSPQLLELCNVTIVHRFLSPAWYAVLRKHLAGAGSQVSASSDALFEMIVGLRTGEAFVFCPTAILDIDEDQAVDGRSNPVFCELQDRYIKIRIRSRVSADGGKSIMASDTVNSSKLTANGSQNEQDFSNINFSFPQAPSTSSPASTFNPVAPPTALPVPSPGPRYTTGQTLPQAPNTSSPASTFNPVAPPPALPVPSPRPRSTTGQTPSNRAIRANLERHALDRLKFGKCLEFDSVRRATTDELRLERNFFSKKPWKKDSANIIKIIVDKQRSKLGLSPVENASLGLTY